LDEMSKVVAKLKGAGKEAAEGWAAKASHKKIVAVIHAAATLGNQDIIGKWKWK
jgi:hypothetical protein